MSADRIPREFWYTRAFRVVPNRFWGGLADSFGFSSLRIADSTFNDVHFRACSVMTSSNLQVIVLAFMFRENSERVFCVTADELCFQLPISDDPNALVIAHFRPNVENHDYETVAYEDWTSAKALADSVTHNGLFDFVFIGATQELRKFLYQMQVLPGIAVPLPLRSSLVQSAAAAAATTAPPTFTEQNRDQPVEQSQCVDCCEKQGTMRYKPENTTLDGTSSSQCNPISEDAFDMPSPAMSGSGSSQSKSVAESPVVVSSGNGTSVVVSPTSSSSSSSSSSSTPSPMSGVPTGSESTTADHPSKGSIIMPFVQKGSRSRTRYRFLDCVISPDGQVIIDGINHCSGKTATEQQQQQQNQQQQQQQQQVKDVLEGVKFPKKRKRTSRSKILELTRRRTELPEPTDSSKEYNCCWLGCHETFSSMSALTAHTQNHTYECPDCICRWEGCQRGGKPFPNHAGLYRHIRYHTGDKPCKCPVSGCTYCSVDNGELLRHMKQVHNIVINS